MDTRQIATFVETTRLGSLAAASRRLGIAPMVASRHIAALERELGVRLMQRSTRSISLTVEGQQFLLHAKTMLAAEREAKSALARSGLGATGLLRITAPAAFGRKVIAPLVPDLLSSNPELEIALQLSDGLEDIVSQGLDVAVRIAPLRDSSLVARRLADNTRLLCATTGYLAEHPAPRTLAQLAAHSCLRHAEIDRWAFCLAGGQVRHFKVSSRFVADTVDGVHAACAAGAGIAMLSTWDVAAEISSGALVPVVLDDARPKTEGIWAVLPSARLVLPKVRVFLEALQGALAV
ncbi:LysR family transcriptional regulator [Erythrobacter sp.]|uniref:LysR family transcriptional regulator n=1 Tax=Erythrobacter sp. TaxID=1042 RepID=UPI00311FC351